MAQKKNKYLDERVYIPVDLYEDDATYDFVKKNYDRQLEPKADFVMPEEGSGDLIMVLASETPVGEIPKSHEKMFNLNIDNCRKAYVSIEEDGDDTGIFSARVVLVVNRAITENDLKQAKRNMILVVGLTMAFLVALAITMFVRGLVVDGLICVAALLFLVYMVFIKKKVKDSVFYRKK